MDEMDKKKKSEFLACAFEAAEEGKKILKEGLDRHRQGNKLDIHYKGEIDLVTDIDKRSEQRISEVILAHFPDHKIVAEEGTQTFYPQGESPYVWFIDPLDGTTNYAHGYPAVSISIALYEHERAILGVVDAPLFSERWHAVQGKGSWLNGESIHVSTVESLSESLLATGFPYDRRAHADFYLRYFKAFMMRCHGIRRNGSAAIDLCNLACGRFDGFWEFKLKPWDVAAGTLIIKEAGGIISDLQGRPFQLSSPAILASNSRIHEEMLKTIAGLEESNMEEK